MQVTGSLFVAGLIVGAVMVTSRALGGLTGLPHPVFLVAAAGVVSFLPGVPSMTLRPSIVFFGLLPPLVYHAGLVTSPRELRANARSIALGAFGLVLLTALAVAGVTDALSGSSIGFAGAFILGAVVAPTDPVASGAVLRRLGAPGELTVILEGESLVNDGIALALFALGTTALFTTVTPVGGFVTFVRLAGGGAGFGLLIGLLATRVRRPIADTPSQVVVSLLVPYAAYLPANALGLSGVLAALTAGLVLGQSAVSALEPAGRLRVAEFWDVLVFLLESVLFVLVGFEVRSVVDALQGYPVGTIAWVVGLTVATVVVVRLAWWALLPRWRWRRASAGEGERRLTWRHRLVLGWGGLRGAISLAAALSVPTLVGHHRYGPRPLIVFATFCVVVVTLIGEGASLPFLVKALHLGGADRLGRERALAARRVAEAALRRLDELAADGEAGDEVAEALRRLYERRIELARAQLGQGEEDGADRGPAIVTVQRRLVVPQYAVLDAMHRKGEISFAVFREVRRELDLEMARLGR